MKKEYKCEGEYGKYLYSGDSRYEKIWEQMQLLGIEDVSTMRQEKNDTIVWKLPIKDADSKLYIEVASFKSGYVRNQGVSCASNYQLNIKQYLFINGLLPIYLRQFLHICD